MKQLLLIAILLLPLWVVGQQTNNNIALPEPQTSGGMPLMEALSLRKSARSFSDNTLSMQQLSNLLWAACGVNRKESGKRTAPSAVNWQQIDVYVVLPQAAYRYEAKENKLIWIAGGDLRQQMGKQSFTGNAAVMLAFICDYSKMGKDRDEESKKFYAATDTGFISQNVYLFCASEGLSSVVLGYIDRDEISKNLLLRSDQKVVLTQAVGFPL